MEGGAGTSPFSRFVVLTLLRGFPEVPLPETSSLVFFQVSEAISWFPRLGPLGIVASLPPFPPSHLLSSS